MHSTRFQILCKDGAWRYVFCRSLNSSDPLTGSQVIPTEYAHKAYKSFGADFAAKSLEYFAEHANGAQVRYEIPIP
jgi:hypothetical protein